MVKYDWNKLKIEYVTGKFKTLKDFALNKGISYAVVRNNAKNWNDRKVTKRLQKEELITNKVIDIEVKREVATIERHYSLWNKFIDIVENCLTDEKSFGIIATNNKTLKALSDVLEKACKGQREALNLDKEDKPNAIDENIKATLAVIDALKERKVEGVEDDEND